MVVDGTVKGAPTGEYQLARGDAEEAEKRKKGYKTIKGVGRR